MTAQIPPPTPSLYEQDYCLWLQTTLQQLRGRQFSSLDLENLIEELEGMVRSDKRATKSLLTKLLEHLLKLAYGDREREYNANHWRAEITAFRVQIKDLLQDSPSLKPYIATIFAECYSDARKIASRRMGCNLNALPTSPIATLSQTLSDDWFPDM